MSTLISAGTSTSGAVINSDTSGSLQLQSGSTPTTGITLSTAQSTTLNSAASTAPLIAQINGTEVARVDSSGNLLVGETSDVSTPRIGIKGTTTDSTSYVIVGRDSSANTIFSVRSDGRFLTGAGTASPYNNTTASVANVYVDSNGILYRGTSSLKYKTNIQDATYGLADVLKLRPVTYQSKSEKDSNKIFGGLIAEEVDTAELKMFVDYADDGTPDALHYASMVSLAFKAIQELSAKVTALEAKVGI